MPRKILFLLLPVLLAGCSSVRDTIGLTRPTPDEFAVVDRAPLILPPDYQLRPPSPGAARPTDTLASDRAAEATFGSARPVTAGTGGAEASLLAAAGATNAAPDIRRTIDKESAQRVSGGRHLVDELLWWRKDKAAGEAVIVDPALELKRMHDAEAAQKPANTGATPVIERRKSGWLGL